MVKSMTGFGSVRSEKDGHSLNVDVKCLNSKFMDLSIRLPKEIQDKEPELRKIVSDLMDRGKIQISMELNLHTSAGQSELINKDLFESYFEFLSSLADDHKADKSDIFRMAIQMPDVVKSGVKSIDEEIWKWIRKSFTESLEKANEFRIEEGKSLKNQFDSSISSIAEALTDIEGIDVERRKKQEQKLQDAIKDIQDKVRVDQNRFEQELIYYLEKLDISEEKVRLKSHLDYFNSTMGESNSNGKRLQFISQEIGREINTIGSKANNAEMQKKVVMMKDELEKIKEQSLNVL